MDHELSGGILLILCTVISLTLANTIGQKYLNIWELPLFGENLAHWINDGLMAIFFLYVGLELKREIYYGELQNVRAATLPIFAAIGGMAVPAFIYFVINVGHNDTIHGIGIPMATDIAFALAVITLVGKNVPFTLKLFLTALAIIDDLGAIIVIAVFYTSDLSLTYMAAAFALLALLFVLNKSGVKSLVVYLIGGLITWFFMLNSGIHATVAGVLLAFTIPTHKEDDRSLSHWLEEKLANPVTFIILPLFALANTAIMVSPQSFSAIGHTYGLGIFLGLVVGKPIGVTLFSLLACKMKLCTLPNGVNWRMVFGAGALAGIGFTMSIFITLLAFDPIEHADYINNAKFIILLSSTAAAIIGFTYLKLVTRNNTPEEG